MNKPIGLLCIGFVLISPIISRAQIWVTRYNGPSNDDDKASAIALDNAGNIYVTGKSIGSGIWMDYTTVKYNSAGIEQWVARYNGPLDQDDWANAIAVDGSGNVYVTGVSLDSAIWGFDYCDYATVKYDASGVQQWVARYGDTVNTQNKANAIAVDHAGNVYVTGMSYEFGSHNYATVKYDSLGVEQWVATYNGHGNGYDEASAIALDDVGNVYVTGGSDSTGVALGYATIKYDSLGVEQWVVRYDGPHYNGDVAIDIAIDEIGNIYITGYSWGPGTEFDYATIKYDSLGVERWVARYSGPASSSDIPSAIAIDGAGNVYVTGDCSAINYGDYTTVKYDSLGVERWVAMYDGANSWDRANGIVADNAGNVYVTGISMGSTNDYATIKYDSLGVEQWVARYDGPGNGRDGATAIAVDDAGCIYVTGESDGTVTNLDYATIKYSQTGIEENTLVTEKEIGIITTIFRGPLQLPEGKKCRVFDITGRAVEPDRIQEGIYFLEIDGKIVQKVIKVR